MTRWIVQLGLLLLGALAAGCTTIATRPDSTDSSASLVNFNLKSTDAVSGSINGTVPDNEPPSGQFF
jgi:hypothetical protein